jgi:hypothetical protein
MQFIPSTRDAYKAKYGVDAWGSDLEAVKAAALHHLSTGVPGYNPGMPSYTSYILGQKINPADIQALRTGAAPGRGAGGGGRRAPGMTIPGRRRPQMSLTTTTTPGTSMAPERQAARRELLLSGDINLKSLLQYATQKKALRDIPGTAETNLDVRLGPRGKARVQGPRDTDLHPQHVKAGLFEVERDGWKGSQSVGRGLVKASGLPVGSEKRSTVNTASGNVSDHYEGNKDSYAWDLSVTGEHGTKVARKLARMLGSKWQGGSWLNVVKKIEGRTYRFQLGWNVPDHYDHIHMGVDRVDTPG